MVRYRQGEVLAARKMLADAAATTSDLDGPQRTLGIWNDWLVVSIFRREAEMLIVPEVAPPPRAVK
jgi:hypothetical protein